MNKMSLPSIIFDKAFFDDIANKCQIMFVVFMKNRGFSKNSQIPSQVTGLIKHRVPDWMHIHASINNLKNIQIT